MAIIICGHSDDPLPRTVDDPLPMWLRWAWTRMKRSIADSSADDSSSKRPKSAGAASTSKSKSGGGPWQMKLLQSMRDPAMIVKSDEQTVIIRDAYPKARHHYLVLPREDIPSLRALNSAHLPLLEKMLANGRALAEEIATRERVAFKCGYHASPSMTRLHMHVISQDFDSLSLKNKKHWNSFTTSFFLQAEEVISILREKGKVELDVRGTYEPMLKLPLRCHVCEVGLQNMPKLKDHIKQHFKQPKK